MIKFEKMDAVRNCSPRGWVIRVDGKIVGPLFSTRKEAAAYAAIWLAQHKGLGEQIGPFRTRKAAAEALVNGI